MPISSQESPAVRRIAHQCYLGVASLILISILSEGLLIGPSLFADTSWGRVPHAVLGALLFLLTLPLPAAGLLARLPRRMILLSAAPWVLTLILIVSAGLGRSLPLLAAFHPASALLLAGLTVLLLVRAWQLRPSTARGDFKRWMYRGQRPNWIARVVNRAWAILFSSGLLPDYMVTLEVTGRKSGRAVSLPVAVAVVDGERYLVSMLGENVNWVQNVRAAGGRAALKSGRREEVRLEEVPAEQRAPILKAYLQRAPGARPHVPVNKEAPLAEFAKIAPAFPVFRVVSAVPAHPGV